MKTKILAALLAITWSAWLEAGEKKSLEELMPQFRAVQVAADDFRVEFKTHEAKEWSRVETKLPTKAAAENVIEESKRKLRLKFEVLTAVRGQLLTEPTNETKANEARKKERYPTTEKREAR